MCRDELHEAFRTAVTEELRRADAQHGEAADLYEMLAVLGEEYGELQQAALDYDYHGDTRDHLLKECVQVGAMACKTFRFIHERLGAPRQPLPLCSNCGREQEDVGIDGGETPFCPAAFHIFGIAT